MAADAMRRFRELHDQLKAQLSDLSQAEQEGEDEGGAEAGAGRAAAQRTYEELVACLNSNDMKEGRGGRGRRAYGCSEPCGTYVSIGVSDAPLGLWPWPSFTETLARDFAVHHSIPPHLTIC